MTTTPGTTLDDELLRAADVCYAHGDFKLRDRLAYRAFRVRELLDLAHQQKFDGGRRELARALTGPIMGPTVPADVPVPFHDFHAELDAARRLVGDWMARHPHDPLAAASARAVTGARFEYEGKGAER